MYKKNYLLLAFIASLTFSACQWQTPTNPSHGGKIALTLDFAQWREYSGEEERQLARTRGRAAISHVDIYVLFDKDTLAHATAQITPGSNEFEAVLEVPIGPERRVIVEAWDDQNGAISPRRTHRGVQSRIEIQPNVAQEVAVTLYPVPVAGQNVVLIVGSANGAPGTSGHFVPVTLISADPLSGLQFDLNYDTTRVAPVTARRAATFAFDTLATNLVASDGGQALRMLLFALSGERLPALFDPTEIINVAFSVKAEAEIGTQSPLFLSNFVVLDQNRNRLGVLAVEGGNFAVVSGR